MASPTAPAHPGQPESARPATVDIAGLEGIPNVAGLQVIVKQETPFLPKVAFTLITLASLAGASLTGTLAGLDAGIVVARWVSMWAIALAGGFAVWRVFYLRSSDPEAAQERVDALNASALVKARSVGRWIAPLLAVSAIGPVLTPYVTAQPAVMWGLIASLLITAGALAYGVHDRAAAFVVVAGSLAVVTLWAYADAGAGWAGAVRFAHLTAFVLWLGGAVWNIWVAMPVGRDHANVDAVIAGAHQLDRFRWVVRFSLPTIIITGLIMAGAYRFLEMSWWLSFPGVLIPLKVLSIVALVVVFITCPLFRHCSPVQGVCDLDDLDAQA